MLEQRRLADARLATQHQHPAVARANSGHELVEPCPLQSPADQRSRPPDGGSWRPRGTRSHARRTHDRERIWRIVAGIRLGAQSGSRLLGYWPIASQTSVTEDVVVGSTRAPTERLR